MSKYQKGYVESLKKTISFLNKRMKNYHTRMNENTDKFNFLIIELKMQECRQIRKKLKEKLKILEDKMR